MRLLTIIAAALGLAAAATHGLAQGPSSAAKKRAADPGAPSAKAAPAKSASARPTAKPTIAQSTPARTAATKSRTKSGVKSKKQVAAKRPPLQQQPTADRYKEIQQALADKGYFRGTVDGAWGTESVEALKRFQHAQNLDADGKIGALSLMALGLGPRQGTASAQAADIAVDPPPVAPPEP